MADQDFARINFDGERMKLRFRHRDLRDAVMESGKSVGELFADPFGGWPFLLKAALRPYKPSMTLDDASELIETWTKKKDPDTGAERTLDDLTEKLKEAAFASGFLKQEKPADPEGDTEGNAAPEAASAATS